MPMLDELEKMPVSRHAMGQQRSRTPESQIYVAETGKLGFGRPTKKGGLDVRPPVTLAGLDATYCASLAGFVNRLWLTRQ